MKSEAPAPDVVVGTGTGSSAAVASVSDLAVPALDPDADALAAALAYAAAGWYVLPVRRGSKKPGSVVGERWQDRSSRDPQQIVAWFAGTDHGIALHCGRSGAVVFDVDKPEQVPDALRRYLDAAPCQSSRPNTPGRAHYVFRQPPGRTIGNGTGGLGGGWGEVRGLNGVIVVAPSVHEDADDPENPGLYRWLRTGPVPELPDELAELLDDASPAEDAASDAQVLAFVAEHLGATRPGLLDAWGKTLAERFATGSRHDAAVSVTVGALKEAAAGYLDARTVVETLGSMFVTAATRPPTGGEKQRTEPAARAEYRAIVAWAVGQATAADPDVVRARIDEKMPDNLAWIDRIPPEGIGLTPPPDDSSTGTLVPVVVGELVPDAPVPPDSWDPVDLEPYLSGTVEPPVPSVGLRRTDGGQVLYPGKDHSVIGETESGKTWFALECAAAELREGRDVLYIHWEEGDPRSTIERLLRLAVAPEDIRKHLHFVAPEVPVTGDRLRMLLGLAPTLVVHDGVNEAMARHGQEINANDGAAVFRNRLVVPCLAAGATVLSCDHVTKSQDGRRRYAIGGVHKVNAVSGAVYMIENVEPFGRGMRGRSNVYVVKDRPGQLRARGAATKEPGKTFFGTLVLDDTDEGPDFLTLYPPRPDDGAGAGASLADEVFDVIVAQPDGAVGSKTKLAALVRAAEMKCRDTDLSDAVEDLLVGGRIEEVPGARGAKGYRALTSSRDSDS